ncbi:MAG: glycosyltransferase [Acidimicrobiales bacterium]
MHVVWAGLHRPDALRGGGWTHAYELLREAARRHRVTLVTGVAPGDDGSDLEALGVELVPVTWARRPPPRSRLGLLARAAAGPGTVGFWEVAPGTDAVARAVAAVEATERVDLVSVFAGEIAPVASTARAPSALLLTDSYTRQGQREVAAASRLRHRLLYALEAGHARRWERTRYRHASALACVSESDAAVLRALTRMPVDVVPNPLGAAFFAPPDRPRRPGLVSIIGALDYRPNVDAVTWFVTDVWPQVLAAAPGTTLRVVGRNPVEDVHAMLNQRSVELQADVADIRPAYWEAAVVVVPLRLGSGVKNKVLHALACGSPLVGTSVAFEDIPVQPGDHVLVADDAPALARAVLAALADPPAAAERAARALPVADAYRADRVADLLDRFWERAARQPRRG